MTKNFKAFQNLANFIYERLLLEEIKPSVPGSRIKSGMKLT